jgi:hypothetical protein
MTSDQSSFPSTTCTGNRCPSTNTHGKPLRLDGHLVICGDWHQCLVVQELMACYARTFGFEDFGIRKAVIAALSNAFKHGNGGAPEKCIRVDYQVDETEFRVSINDDGVGFDHESIVTGGMRTGSTQPGQGLGLMRSYMTAVRFNRLGNRVELTKKRVSLDQLVCH